MTTLPASLLSNLKSAFARLERLEGQPGEHPDQAWVELLEQREQADPLTDDAFLRGWVVGIADALGLPLIEVVRAARGKTSRPRRRIVETPAAQNRVRQRRVDS